MKTYSEETKRIVLETIVSGNFPTLTSVSRSFEVSPSTLRRWLKESGLQYTGYTPESLEKESGPETKVKTVPEEKKELRFLEPDPDPSTFKSDAEKANYYMLRAHYLEELFRLCDLDEVSKKKALLQLEQRVRERLARGDKSPY